MAKVTLNITSGSEFAVRVTPNASRNTITTEDGAIRVYVTTIPEDGKATAAVIKLLAKSLGVAKSRITLIRGATGRDKQFRLD
ncbi:DUF167 domain-containing protein [Pseudorhodobacter sp. W20_MBD10_FR17]|uniref:DUF167 domain-containing protein n=1 Tax=Pseudorhodobacter sp. W20_MBD10_FR17 TaxID=3240266 RepID=UPI003F9CAA98